MEPVARPANLDGDWEERPTDSDHYRHFHVGPVEVRGFESYEPDGELVTNGPVRVHMERMSDTDWWLALSWGRNDRHEVHVNLSSKKPISVRWSEER
jgi:hypothetical protein